MIQCKKRESTAYFKFDMASVSVIKLYKGYLTCCHSKNSLVSSLPKPITLSCLSILDFSWTERPQNQTGPPYCWIHCTVAQNHPTNSYDKSSIYLCFRNKVLYIDLSSLHAAVQIQATVWDLNWNISVSNPRFVILLNKQNVTLLWICCECKCCHCWKIHLGQDLGNKLLGVSFQF